MANPPTKDYPIRHMTGFHFQLLEEDTGATDFATMFPLFFADQAKDEDAAEAIHTHPLNDDYVSQSLNSGIHMNSRVNNIHVREYVMIPPAYDVPDMLYNKMVVSWGVDDHSVVDAVGATILTNLGFQKNADSISPNYTGTDLPLTNVWPADCDGLTTDTQGEPVAKTPANMRFSREQSILNAKVRTMTSPISSSRVHKDYPYYSDRWYSSPPRCRRANAFTGCFLYIGLIPVIADGASQASSNILPIHFNTDSTIDEPALSCHYTVEFNEYNDAFDNSP